MSVAFEELLARVEALEAGRTVDLDQLPLAALQRKLESRWSPDAARLLLDKSVTAEQLGNGTLIHGEGVRLRLVRGEVSAAGAVVRGTGFTVVRNAAGDYTVTFAAAFKAVPVVVPAAGATAGILSAKLHSATAPTAALFRVATFNVAAALADSIFDFIAIGLET